MTGYQKKILQKHLPKAFIDKPISNVDVEDEKRVHRKCYYDDCACPNAAHKVAKCHDVQLEFKFQIKVATNHSDQN